MTNLPLFSARTPPVSDQEVAWMLRALEGKGWVTAKQLRDFCDDRTLRAIAAASQGQIISGSKGYKLTADSTIEEVDHAERRLRSQAREMLRRAIQIRKYRNGQRVEAA